MPISYATSVIKLQMIKSKLRSLGVVLLVSMCVAATACTAPPFSRTPSATSFSREMEGSFRVVESVKSRAGFSRMTASFNAHGTSGNLVVEYLDKKPPLNVNLFDCVSYARHIRPGFMYDSAAVEQDIHEVRCRSTGSLWRFAMFDKGTPGINVTDKTTAATGYEFAFTVPFPSIFAVQPDNQM